MNHDSYTIETDGARKRYRCTCGKAGSWTKDFDSWRRITAEKAVAWNYKVHATLSNKGLSNKGRVQGPAVDEHW